MSSIAGVADLQVLRHRNLLGADVRALQRAVLDGRMVRLRSGAYVSAATWSALEPRDRMRLEAAAAHEAGRGAFVASHATAAALWDIPRISRPDEVLHARASLRAGSRTEHGVRKHAVSDVDLHVTEVLGIPVTTLERTVIDLALSGSFGEAVVAADWALRSKTSRAALQRTLDELAPARGRARAQRVVDFADPDSGSPGESWSRTQIYEAGLPAPLLQTRFSDASGLIGYVDFFWPDHALIGEFDGMEKYANPDLLRGRTPQQALQDEKLREDRLRATGPGVSRWIWRTLLTRGALLAQLSAAGLPLARISGRSATARA